MEPECGKMIYRIYIIYKIYMIYMIYDTVVYGYYAYHFFCCIIVYAELCKETYIFNYSIKYLFHSQSHFETNKKFIFVFKNSQTKELLLVKLSHPLKVLITFKIFNVFNIVQIRNQRMLEEV